MSIVTTAILIRLLAQAVGAECETSSPALPGLSIDVPEPGAQKVSYGSIYDWGGGRSEAQLGIGHIRSNLKETRFYWEWEALAELPLYSAPNGEHWGWFVKGQVIELETGTITTVGGQGMVETGYERASLIVLEKTTDSWLHFRYGKPSNKRDGTAWIHRCQLAQAPGAPEFEPWEQRFMSGEISPLYFRTEVPHALRSGPGVDYERIRWVAGEDYHLEPLEFAGDWMRVKLVQPSDYCRDPDNVKRPEGWVRWRSAEKSPWVWYYTRGC
ncbi:MAG: hypothetical protein OEU36_09300 [Gammaproteobacteria bacterium]|nr:hypothetical protein [Gammaproteobacteria bacterium]